MCIFVYVREGLPRPAVAYVTAAARPPFAAAMTNKN